MPTLVEKKDGGYIVHHRYQEYSTWQIDEDGVGFWPLRYTPWPGDGRGGMARQQGRVPF